MDIKFLMMGATLITLMICFVGCTDQQNDVDENTDQLNDVFEDNEQQYTIVEGTGTIVFNNVQGGFYGIVADMPFSNYSTNHLYPIELLEDFKEDGLRVWFEVQLKPDVLDDYDWGIMVEILGIEKID